MEMDIATKVQFIPTTEYHILYDFLDKGYHD